MDKNRVAGAAKQARGAGKEAIGKAVGDTKSRVDGNADKAVSGIQSAIGGAREAPRGGLNK